MNRYEVTGRANVTTQTGSHHVVELDKEVVPAPDPLAAPQAAVLQILGRQGVKADTIMWFRPATVRPLEGDQPTLPIAGEPPAAKGVTPLNPKLIRTDGGTQARAGLNEDKVNEYAERMAEGDKFPPVTVFYDGSTYWLGDGFHRVAAHRKAFMSGMVEIAVEVKQGTRRDAVLYACGANSDHGLPRTREDKIRAVTTLLEDEEWARYSDREIARRCKVTHPFVAKLRASSSDHTGNITSMERTFVHPKTGQETTMNTAAIGKSPVPRIMQVAAEAPAAPAVQEKGNAAAEKPADFDECLRRALRAESKAGYWAERRATGLTDEELKHAISLVFGIAGSQSGPGQTPFAYKGGRHPEFHCDSWNHHYSKPSLHGAALVRAARDLLEIPYPGETGNPTATPPTPSAPDYASIWQLEQRVRAWLEQQSEEAFDIMERIKARRGEGGDFSALAKAFKDDTTAPPFRVGDLWQACNNVWDQLRQRQPAQPQPLPEPLLAALIANPLDILADKLAALDDDTRHELGGLFDSIAATLEHRPEAMQFVDAIVWLLVGEDEEEYEPAVSP